MWLDSKAVNCPQKWGNFTVTSVPWLGLHYWTTFASTTTRSATSVRLSKTPA